MAENGNIDTPQPELARMEAAVQQLLLGVGEDPSREGLVDTPRVSARSVQLAAAAARLAVAAALCVAHVVSVPPRSLPRLQRVAKAWLDMTRGYRQECKSAFGTALFHEPTVAAGADGLVVVRDITFAALSEATLLPFHGRCHIAYVPAGGVVLGLSKLARVTKCLAARLQTQQQFAERLVAAVQAEVAAAGVAAVVQAVHLGCGPAPLANTTVATCGCFARPASGQLQEFLALLRLGGQSPAGWEAGCDAAAAEPDQQQQQQQQQQQGLEEQPEVSSSMAAAADTLLQCVGEDPTRKVRAGC
jgi:GTP cyclohydrolase I